MEGSQEQPKIHEREADHISTGFDGVAPGATNQNTASLEEGAATASAPETQDQ